MEITPIQTGTQQTFFSSGGVSLFSGFKIKTDGSYDWNNLFRAPKASENIESPNQLVLRNAVGDRANYLYETAKTCTNTAKLESYVTEMNGLYDALQQVQEEHGDYLTVEDNQRIDQIGQYANLIGKLIPNSAPKTEDFAAAMAGFSTTGLELEQQLQITQQFVTPGVKPTICEEFKEGINQLQERIQLSIDNGDTASVQSLSKTFMQQAEALNNITQNMTLTDSDMSIIRHLDDCMDIYEPFAQADDMTEQAIQEQLQALAVTPTAPIVPPDDLESIDESEDVTEGQGVDDVESESGLTETSKTKQTTSAKPTTGVYPSDFKATIKDVADINVQRTIIDQAKQAMAFNNVDSLSKIFRDLNALKFQLEVAANDGLEKSQAMSLSSFKEDIYTPALTAVRKAVTTPISVTWNRATEDEDLSVTFGDTTYTIEADEGTDGVVGAGATGRVYAMSDDAGNVYAVKKLNKLTLEKAMGVDPNNFDAEYFMQAMCTANDNVGGVMAYGQDDQHLYILQDYVDGGSLEDYALPNPALGFKGDGVYQNDTFEKIANGIVSGYEELSYQGIMHRDFKPDNYLITSDGDVKLIDFGNAQFKEADGVYGLFGTPGYININHVNVDDKITFKPDIPKNEEDDESDNGEETSTGKISDQIDTYGVYVTLLETLTGVSCADENSPVFNAAVKQNDISGQASTNVYANRIQVTSIAHDLLYSQVVNTIGQDHPYVQLLDAVKSGQPPASTDMGVYSVS